jgi:hypothetical protein
VNKTTAELENDIEEASGRPEEWRMVGGTNWMKVSNDGRVMSCLRQKSLGRGKGSVTVVTDNWNVLKTTRHATGRRLVRIRGRRVFVHRLVLEAFVGPCPAGKDCLHWNDIPDDNRLENLRWGTHGENVADRTRNGGDTVGERHGMAKLTERDVIEIRKFLADGWFGWFVAKLFGVTTQMVYRIKLRHNWKQVAV